MDGPQSSELTRGPPELVQHFRLLREFTSAQERALLDPKLIWFGYIALAYPSGEKGGNLLVQIISTCRHGLRRGGGGSAPCGMDIIFFG
jgi:hypothetical protein